MNQVFFLVTMLLSVVAGMVIGALMAFAILTRRPRKVDPNATPRTGLRRIVRKPGTFHKNDTGYWRYGRRSTPKLDQWVESHTPEGERLN
jgi:hypothetical protein